MTSSAGLPRPDRRENGARPSGPDCFLGVEKSLTGKRWISREADERHSLALAQRLSVPEIVGRVLAARGVGLEDADVFLRPTLKHLLPDPSRLKDMDTAAERLARAIIDSSLETAGKEFAESRREGESLEEALFAHVAVALRHLRPHRGYVGDVVESTLSPFSRAGGEGTADGLRVRHLETVRAIIEQHTSPSTPLPSAVTMHLYWTLYLGVLAFWATHESPNQEDALVLLDQALRLFVGSLETSRSSVENTHAP